MQVESQKLLFVINHSSGSKNQHDYETEIREYFNELPHTVKFYILSGTNDVPAIEELLKNFEPQKVIAVGGDGTVNLVAKILMGSGTQMGIVPAGSANGMAKELNMPTAFNNIMELIVNGNSFPTDIIKINDDDICLHLSDIGLNARLIKYFEEGNMRGKLGYAKVALKVLARKQNISVVIEAESRKITRNAFMVVLANASKYGTGAVINPEGSLHDGFFEIVIIRQLAILEIIKMWFNPKPFNKKNIEIIKGCSVHISTGHSVHFQVDGEYKGKVREVKASIVPGALQLIIPGDEKSTLVTADKYLKNPVSNPQA